MAQVKVAQTHKINIFARHAPAHILRNALHLQTESDVLQNLEPGKQRMLLKHDTAVGARACNRLAAKRNVSFGGLDKPGQKVQECCLAA